MVFDLFFYCVTVKTIYRDAMLVPIRMGTNMAAGNQQKHLSLSFTSKA